MKAVKLLLLGITLSSLSVADMMEMIGEDPDRPSYHERITSPQYTQREREAAREEFVRERGYDPGYVDPGYSMKCDPSVYECF